MQLQPNFAYNLMHEWYLFTNPTISADWTQVAIERWFIPLGGRFGKTFNVGRQPVDANLAVYRNIRRASQLAPQWQLSAQVTLLFAKRR